MRQNKTNKAIIYCRVSGTKQVREGHGLESQETRCREYAKFKGYEVVKVLFDDVTGKTVERKAMTELLVYLRQHKKSHKHVVIIDDISRFARNLKGHLELRMTLADAGGILESPSIEFGEDSDSVLVENLLASVAQHQREKNAEQTVNRMRARFMNGYWVFQAPLGYKYKKTDGHGKLLTRNEPAATIIIEVLEGFASGKYQSPAEIKRYLETQTAFPKNRHGKVSYQRVTELLTKSLYAGYMSHKNWGQHLIKGKHKPLIGYETFQKIQKLREEKPKVVVRKSINDDFPLRGFVCCSHCGEAYTACWSKGEYKSYAYYLCDTKGCEVYRKSIPRKNIEGDFEELLRSLKPSQMLFSMAYEMLKELWDNRSVTEKANKLEYKRNIIVLENQTQQFLDRVVNANNNSLITAYEKRIQELDSEKIIIAEKINKCGTTLGSFDEIYRTAFTFLENPHKLWTSKRLEDRRAVLKLVFVDTLSYSKDEGYRTAKTTLPFRVLGDVTMGKYDMVRPRRLELPRVLPHSDLNAARLPVPPRPHKVNW